MNFPFDILDSIIFFLRPHPESLIACSEAHPVLSQAVERHLYYHITFHSTSEHNSLATGNGYSPGESKLMKILTKSPHIATYIRILQIDFSGLDRTLIEAKIHNFSTITPILPIFPSLECIMLLAPYRRISWKQLPQNFKMAVENCLRLPTLREVHVGHLDFPLSILENQANINYLRCSGYPQLPDSESNNTYPQLRTLSLDLDCQHKDLKRFITWVKRHIVNLQSLKCGDLDQKDVLELLEVCSGTLNSLDFYASEPYETIRNEARKVHDTSTSSLSLSSFLHLQHFTILTGVHTGVDHIESYYLVSYLPAVVSILEALPPALLHLTIDMELGLQYLPSKEYLFSDFLTALAEYAPSIPHVDLYVHSYFADVVDIVSLFANQAGLAPLIERGTLVINGQQGNLNS